MSIGLWLEKTLAPKVASEGSETEGERDDGKATAPSSGGVSSGGVVPERGEPHGYIRLAADVFAFINQQLVGASSSWLRAHVAATLGEQHVVIVAAVVRDLDRETARTKSGAIAAYFGASLGALYHRFSHFLTLYTHNLLATGLLVPSLQLSLLQHLGVNPQPTDQPWPLQVSCALISSCVKKFLIFCLKYKILLKRVTNRDH